MSDFHAKAKTASAVIDAMNNDGIYQVLIVATYRDFLRKATVLGPIPIVSSIRNGKN